MDVEVPEFVRKAMEAQGRYKPEELPDVDLDAPTEPEQMALAPEPVVDPIPEIPEPQTTIDALAPRQPAPIVWEEFFTRSEVETTKRVRRGQQQLGPLARKWIAARVGGTIGDGGRSAKQFVNTPRGKFRVSLSVDGDNTTEMAAHERMGAEAVAVEDVQAMVEFFSAHDLPGWETYQELREHLRGAIAR